MKLLSDLYNVTLKRGIRGKASEGFIRPTIGQSFMTDRDFEEISGRIDYYWDENNPTYNFDNSILRAEKSMVNWTSAKILPTLPKSGKYYWEVHVYGAIMVGIANDNFPLTTSLIDDAYLNIDSWAHYQNTNAEHHDIGVAVDFDNNSIWFSRDGVWLDNNPVDGINPRFSNINGQNIYATISIHHTDSYHAGGWQYAIAKLEEGTQVYPAPTGFSYLN